MRDRWTGWTAVTTPIRGRAMRARSAISPPVYIPISRTAASCSGPRRMSVSGRPTSLFWLPSLRSVRKRRPRTAATASLVDVLAMLPVTPTTSGSNRRPPAGGDRPERGERIGDADDRDVAERGRVGDRSRDDERGGSPGDRVGQVRVAIGPLTGECDEDLARRDEPGIDGGTTDRSLRPGEKAAPGQAHQVVGREGGPRNQPRGRGRRVDVGHGRQCRTGRDHRSAIRVGVTGRSASRSGVVIASVAIRRKSSNDMTGISRWPTRATVGVPSSIRIATTRSGTPVWRPM